MPQVAFTTLGCKVNQFETEVMEGLFKVRGYKVVDFDQHADIYVINTCSVTNLGEKKSRQLIRRASRQNPAAIIAVAGCYSQVSPDKVSQIPGVDVIVGTQDRTRIVELVEEAANNNRTRQVNVVADIMQAKEFEDIPLFSMPGRTRAFLKIQEGCTNFCTYCIIPYARGPLRSRTLASIAVETEKLVAAGFNEIVLTGIHLGAFGRDLVHNNGAEITLVEAVETVLSAGVQGLMRLRLGSLESIELSDRLISLMQTDKRLCPHLHLPLQAGDDQILMAMNRQYTTAEYRELITNIKAQVPGIAITTDIIVGFPGETDELFENTLNFVATIGFAKIHVFPYSRRTGTPAAEFSEQVPAADKKIRVQRLQRLADKQSRAFYQSFLGQKLDVLFDTVEAKGIISGLTGNYARIYAAGNQESIGRIAAVKLERFHQDGLWGQITEYFS
ncbi:tRNA (N(6)-L-threonylcarbamoyladenosine(37)-C(2))-methylthiotransferase MtaB [Sporomusa sp. KB1]|jgi:threonylcarbamoyladenosine tRNA methylthiotransferase MtaB|uniref:tRNA (N(6)-L-threonylcarbamoyladenosine(37)-C(2))- methylthiotransferase MtaB n=1 Tax=Sporomusa sp. KB1 TaxID=943346 RepID=UPI0011A60A9C|nr:tRNA (N(6)-L-threonylcarbamoyladenosine(37)-C(2))-methylthiotransferase MtaB [Sporomusa sp. KB1]TWH48761.1 threonylcarbamoyladenosine tRNA methylthiotransferase MtaB [Sporomusa sp. KB1]